MDTGNVRIHAAAMPLTVSPRTPAPPITMVPATPDYSTWVVLTGNPSPPDSPIVAAATIPALAACA